MGKNLKEVIMDHDKQVGMSRNALAKLFRTLLLDLNIKHHDLDQYIVRYLDDPTNAVPRNNKDRSSEKGNLLKQLGKDAITWRIFTKGLKLLRPKQVRLILEFTDQKNITTVHSVDLTGSNDDLIDESED
mgnify:FL=1